MNGTIDVTSNFLGSLAPTAVSDNIGMTIVSNGITFPITGFPSTWMIMVCVYGTDSTNSVYPCGITSNMVYDNQFQLTPYYRATTTGLSGTYITVNTFHSDGLSTAGHMGFTTGSGVYPNGANAGDIFIMRLGS